MRLKTVLFVFLPLMIISVSCATFYQINYNFNYAFENGNLDEAERLLDKSKRLETSRDRFLYYLNQGVVLSMQGQYELSNEYFEKAYIFGEDFHVNYFYEVASFLTNPGITIYRGEDHEHLILLYYKAMNFLKMNRHEEALIECRRLDIRLKQLSDRYASDNKYRRDAFVHVLMGIIYDADKDYNNAFIAYRNAVEVYREVYRDMFGVSIPHQLKEDLLRTAYLTGFDDEFRKYQEEFGLPDYRYQKVDAQLVFFWQNGLGPVKSEWSINFAVVRGRGGVVNFANDEYGFNFPFRYEYDEENEDGDRLKDLEFFRVAFPKYIERKPLYTQATIEVSSKEFPLELTEDINAVAFQVLQQRMLREFGKGLLRAAVKKAAEYQARKKDEGFGAALSLFNALTEKADTRNWQTIPHSIYYARVPLKEGKNEVEFKVSSGASADMDQQYEFIYNVNKGETIVHTFSSLEMLPRYRISRYY